MALSFQTRFVRDVAIVNCVGRIGEGAESTALREHVDQVLQSAPAIILDLGGVQFIDSSGLGLLVRIVARTGQGNLKLCAVPARVGHLLKMTRLADVFECCDSEQEALASFDRGTRASTYASHVVSADIVCVHGSADVLVFVQEVLRHTGFSVLATNNVPDAVLLLKTTQPKLAIVSSGLRAGPAPAQASLAALLDKTKVLELPADFGRRDPAEAGQQLVSDVRRLMGQDLAAL
jgi:anti-sigma B factor antagonist